jgi:hypothetical protein
VCSCWVVSVLSEVTQYNRMQNYNIMNCSLRRMFNSCDEMALIYHHLHNLLRHITSQTSFSYL